MFTSKKSRIWGIIILTIPIFFISFSAYAKYSGGRGEPNDPYQIATAEDLMLLGETPQDYGKHFILTDDIDLDPNLPGRKIFDRAVIAPYTGTGSWISFQGRSFTGVFDGNGHIISHPTITGEYYVGLFGQLASGSKIKNLGVVGVNITGSNKVGGLVGQNYSGDVTRCYSTGTVSGGGDVGGLAGYTLGGNVTCSYSTVNVSGSLFVGGLVGEQWGTVTNCYSTGTVICTWHGVGGMLGGNWGAVTNCYSAGQVSGTDGAGGFVGVRGMMGSVTDSFWDIRTSHQATSAGGTGKTPVEMKMAATFTNWDFEEIWTIQEDVDYPKLQWQVYGIPSPVPTIIEKLSGDNRSGRAGFKLVFPLTVLVKDQDDTPMPDIQVEFVVTEGGGMVEPALALTDNSGTASTELTLGPTPGLNQVMATVDGLSVSFNITGLAPGYGGGTGEPNDPYQVWTAEQMNEIGAVPNDWDKHFKLMADIDMSMFDGKDGRCVFNVIGTNSANAFTGTFDGAGKTIRNLSSTLFGYVRDSVKNLRLADPNCVGSPVESNYGTIAYCCVQGGNVLDDGGLVGNNHGTVTHCYSTVAVSSSNAGGLVGRNYGGVTYCYSAGKVSGSSAGGLVGDCSLMFATVLHCVWDVEASGISESAGGVGLTTSEMMDPDMLGLNGFANDPNWILDAGCDYPRLAWEGTPGQIIPEPNIDWLDGDGTAEAPYQIDTTDQLIMLSRASALWEKHLVLGADIDLDPNLPDVPIFTQAPIQVFTGVFDGNGHTISHLKVTGVSYIGLFGRLEYGGEVNNLGVVDVNVSGYRYIGGLVGLSRSGRITNCYTTGTVEASGGATGGFDVGGLVGSNVGPVTRSYSAATVSGTRWSVGGLFGYSGGYVQQCYSTGVVEGGWNVGGMVGENGGTLIQCCNYGPVSGSSDVGGLVGDNRYGDMTDCYSIGAVKGGGKVGGLVGESWGPVNNCYSTGAVTGNSNVGGLVGIIGIDPWAPVPTVTDSFWDIETSGRTTSAGGTGKTTAEMQNIITYQNAGWDFVGEMQNGLHEIWQMPVGGGYPVLAILSGYIPPRLQGQGTAQDPYLIYDALELGAMVNYSPSAHYRLAASIDLLGICWRTAVIPFFGGTFDGNNLTITHLTIGSGNCVGLFGQLESGAEVKDLCVVDVNISGSDYAVGGLVGVSGGTVMQCHSTGTVSGDSHVGGLVGYNYGTVTQCYSTGVVSGIVGVGGLVGYSYDTLTHCYSTCVVDGNDIVGGLVGENWGAVTNCYSVGAVTGNTSVGGLLGNVGIDPWSPVPTATNSFWDTQTSGQATSADGTGKTTAEMQTANTFLDASWDFVGETANGTEDIWWIDEGRGYPRLWWELIPEN